MAILKSLGIRAALISAGSSTLYGLGAPPHQRGWRVVIPGNTDGQAISAVLLRDTSLSSANCKEKNFTRNGHLYCHIMDPRTLQPVEGRLHVSILNDSATASDALSNVLFVDTPEESLKFLAKFAPGSRAVIVSAGLKAPRYTLYRWPSALAKPAVRTNSAR